MVHDRGQFLTVVVAGNKYARGEKLGWPKGTRAGDTSMNLFDIYIEIHRETGIDTFTSMG